MHIAIAGNIGSGKTTLTYLLSKYYGYEAIYEDHDDNPYIVDFYTDMKRWSFNLQMSFLHLRLRTIHQISAKDQSVIQDRTIYEDAQIFAPNLHSMGLMSTRDYETYRELFEAIAALIRPPDLLIYLKSSIPSLVEHIHQRHRDYETSIRIDYLKSLNDRYNEWYDNYDYGKKMYVSIDEYDFKNNPEHLGKIINRIKGKLYGLFRDL